MIDPSNGGLRGAPKFPQCALLRIAVARRHAHRTTQRFFEPVEHSLERMCEGGIYDHLGGGFSRYSVDENWLVPHFEKMLYDNAQLLELLALGVSAHRQRRCSRRASRETVGWLEREMTDRGGRVLPPRSTPTREGEEGKFYVWSRDEIVEALGPEDAEFFAQHYDVTTGGKFRGPQHPQPAEALCRAAGSMRGATETRGCQLLRGKLLTGARAACGPGSTTRCWPTGMA